MKQGEWGKEQTRVPLNILKAHGVSLWWEGIMERPVMQSSLG